MQVLVGPATGTYAPPHTRWHDTHSATLCPAARHLYVFAARRIAGEGNPCQTMKREKVKSSVLPTYSQLKQHLGTRLSVWSLHRFRADAC